MGKTKIIFDGRFLSLEHAGLGRYATELLAALLPLDKKQKYIVLVSTGAKIDRSLSRAMYERDEPVEIIEVKDHHYSLSEQLGLKRLLDSLKPDLVHFPHFNHPFLYRGSFVVTVHDLTLSRYAERGNFLRRTAYHKVMASAVRRSAKILTVSNFVKKEIAEQFKVPVSKIVTTYNGIDKKFTKITNPRVLKRAEKYGLSEPYILSVGQWREHKNLVRLVEAFALIQKKKRWKGRIDLVFVGREDPKYPRLAEAVSKLGLGKSIKSTGFVEDNDLVSVYNCAKVFVMPSLSEGFGLPGLEAQSCGVPVASSRATALPEVYGRGAHYFNPTSSSDMAKKIREILEYKKLSQELVERGFANAAKFTWEQTARKTLEVYRKILYK